MAMKLIMRPVLSQIRPLTSSTARHQLFGTTSPLAAASALIQVDENNGLRRIVMKDTKTRNALSLQMMTEITDAIQQNKSHSDLRCITIGAVDGPVFCAGHNLKELTSDNGVDAQKDVFAKCTELMLTIRKAEVPVIAVVNGLAAAAGCQLVAACDFSIATESARFSTPGASFGIFCSTPGVGVARAVHRSTAAFMVLTGMPITAQEALLSGLVTKVVPEKQLDSIVNEIYANIKSKSRPVIRLGKEFFYHQLALSYEEALKQGEGVMVKNLQMADSQEGLKSFKEKRKPNWTHLDD